ncbi:hypothetical protein GO730_10900 [Spirosoma sp. HMF3257]|uniref:Uncharacterized protein n=1 Tax=Spirosoma telluris TaxID=2183553 RepID=A0A327NJS5_9BACT|nr:hypothetical protein [Spirosoma telluris]RAI74639.1 hypothetical protein HMF3257_10825 [Spirosoma telluris]
MIATTTTTAIGSTVGVLNTTDGNVDVLIQKDSDPTQLRFSIPNNISLVATLDGGTFYMPPQSTAEKTAYGYSYFKNYEGDGAFSDNKLTFNFSLSAKTDQVTAKQVTILRGKKK